jgi:CRISPR-associated endonuclease/helicase Cas3
MNIQKYFWAKITSEGKPGISVLEHMINVGNVAQSISEHSIDLLHRFNLSSEEIGALAALHDLGKISPGFQMKCDAWLHENNFHDIAKNNVWDTQMETDHGKVSHSALQIFLNEISLDSNIAKYVSAVLGAHHGRLNPPNDRGFKPCGAITENKTGIDWNTERELAAKTIWEIFKAHDINALSDTSPVLWWLAGLTSVADWIGSDERFFSSSKQVELISKKVIALNALEHRLSKPKN